jgi:hypothetical protein
MRAEGPVRAPLAWLDCRLPRRVPNVNPCGASCEEAEEGDNERSAFERVHGVSLAAGDDLNQHGPLRIKRIVVVERGRKWIATITYTEGE